MKNVGKFRRWSWTYHLELVFPVVITLILTAVVTVTGLIPMIKAGIVRKKQEMIRELTVAAAGTFSYYNRLVENGVITLEDAQNEAAEQLRTERYGPHLNDYFWILDTSTHMIMHPYLTELEGDDLSEFTDDEGVALFSNMVRLANADGSGFVEYRWQKYNESGRLVPKLSFVALYEPWGWIVGTGVYTDDVEQEIKAMLGRFGLMFSIIALIAAAMTTYFIILNVKARKKVWDVLNKQEIFVSLVENAHEFIGFTGLDGYAISLNAAGREMVGLDASTDITTTHMRDYFRQDDEPFLNSTVLPTLMREGRWSGEMVLQHFSSGEYIEVAVTGFLLRDSHTGEPDVIAAVMRDITIEKQAMETLRLSEERIREFAELLPEIVYEMDSTGKLLFVNKHAFNITGYPPDIIHKGFKALDLFIPGDRDRARRNLELIMSGINIGMQEYNAMRADKSMFPVMVRSVPVRRNGVTTGVRGMIVDISERKHSENQLKRSELRLKLALDSAKGSVFQWDCVHDTMSYVARNQNRESGELVPTAMDFPRWKALIHPDDIEMVVSRRNDVLEGRTDHLHFEYRSLDEAGSWEWLMIRGGTIEKDADGRPLKVIGVISDISDLKKAEAGLQQSQDMLASIIKTIPDIIYRVDPDGIIRFISECVTDYGYAPAELIGTNIIDLVHPDDRDRARYHVKERRTGARKTESFEVRLLLKNKEYTSFKVKSTAVKSDPVFTIDAEGLYSDENHSPETFLGTQGVVRDVTERKMLSEQLMHSQKMESIAHLAGGVAHDFNNLLTVILGNAELLVLSTSDNHPLRSSVDEIRATSERAVALTRQLLAFSRRQPFAPRVVDVNGILINLDRMLRRLIGENITIATKTADALWPVKIDPGQLEQVITNLVINGRDAITGPGRITIETANMTFDESYTGSHFSTAAGDYVMLSVHDTGMGMDKETMMHIFEPFFTTKERGKGTGLGLSTCHGIVLQNNGTIWVYSEPGQGTTFKVYLPRTTETADHDDAVADADMSPAMGGKILVVEDEEIVRNLVVRGLTDRGYSIDSASSGAEALRFLGEKNGRYNLVITDVVMPGMSGPVLADEIKDHFPAIPILFMSGYSDDMLSIHSFGDEDFEFIEKPFSPTMLFSKVRRIIEARRPV